MLNLKSKILLLTLFAVNANAQFYDLDQDYQELTAQEQYALDNADASIKVEDLPSVPAAQPSSSIDELFGKAEGLEAFTTDIVERQEPTVHARSLSQLDSIGLNTVFDEALWLGLDYDYAKKTFNKISQSGLKSQTVKDLFKEMLLAKARVPQTQNSWLNLRLHSLLNMGYVLDSAKLLSQIYPQELVKINNSELNEYYLKSNLLNPNVMISKLVKDLLKIDPQNINYKKALMIDLMASGKIVQAKISFGALAEFDTQFAESNFAKLFSAILNESKVNVDSFVNNLDIFDQYLIALRPNLFEISDYSNFNDKALLILVQKEQNKDKKINLAELLINYYPNNANYDLLLQAYGAYNFKVRELSVPLKYIKESENQFANRALLFQASKVKGLNATKAIALKQLWDNYSANNLDNLKPVVNYQAQEIKIDRSIPWFSAELLKNELKQANTNSQVIRRLYENIDNSYMNNKILNLQISLEFLRSTALLNDDVDMIQDYKQTLQNWFNSLDLSKAESYNFALKVLTMLDALDQQIPQPIWAKLYEHNTKDLQISSNPIWLRLVTSAIEKQEKGKALLLIAETFVQNDENSLDAQTLANIIACFNYLNMPQYMAQIGMQALIK